METFPPAFFTAAFGQADWTTAALALLHVLVFVYWLGGDLGAFYASSLVTDAKRPPAARAAAATVLANVDMAPRTALILAAPTGLWLAARLGWVAVSPALLAGLSLAFLAWLALAWRIHLTHAAPGSMWRRLDLAVRWIALAGLLASAALLSLPAFLRAKLLLLAAAIVCGLLIRRALAPFGPAFGRLMAEGPSAEVDAMLAATLATARPFVLVIWASLITAALLGLAAPA